MKAGHIDSFYEFSVATGVIEAIPPINVYEFGDDSRGADSTKIRNLLVSRLEASLALEYYLSAMDVSSDLPDLDMSSFNSSQAYTDMLVDGPKKMLDAYEVPMIQYRAIKAGADFVTPDGEVVPNHRLTTDPTPPKRFAYMSDTAYTEKHLDLIYGVDCLYHESTFLTEDAARIKATLHSSAAQAATLAKKAEVKQLIIGHYSARYDDRRVFLDEARAIFPNTQAAFDGANYIF